MMWIISIAITYLVVSFIFLVLEIKAIEKENQTGECDINHIELSYKSMFWFWDVPLYYFGKLAHGVSKRI